jgi:predicted ATPase
MVGRDAELLTLQNIFHDAMEDAETRVVTVVGEAGVGKSRLLYEFENWIELLQEQIRYFKGRATSEMQVIPYSIARDLFAFRFEILESDSAVVVLERFRAGMEGILDAGEADLVGHLVGFDFSASQAVRNLLGNPSFGELAMAYLTDYIRAMASEPTVIFLEDMHWADDRSLDRLDHLVTAIPDARLLVVCLTRPPLFERRPNWGEGREAHTQLNLKPLSRRASRALVGEILQKVENIPNDLRDLVVDGAEGNPFYVEELIKMLIEDGVILRGEEQWRVALDRLTMVRGAAVPLGRLTAQRENASATGFGGGAAVLGCSGSHARGR